MTSLWPSSDQLRQPAGTGVLTDHGPGPGSESVTNLAQLARSVTAVRKRLAHEVVDGSIPGDLARDEQDRIRRELDALARS